MHKIKRVRIEKNDSIICIYTYVLKIYFKLGDKGGIERKIKNIVKHAEMGVSLFAVNAVRSLTIPPAAIRPAMRQISLINGFVISVRLRMSRCFQVLKVYHLTLYWRRNR